MNEMKKLAVFAAVSLLSMNAAANDDEYEDDNWYVRADAGISFMQDQNTDFNVSGTYPSPDPNNPDFNFTYHYHYNTEFEDAIVGQLGIGYIFNDWFRSDLTVAQDFERDLTGTCQNFNGTHDNNIGKNGTCVADTTDEVIHQVGDLNSSLMSSRLMLNGYLDFADLWTDEDEIAIFRPYVGFGIGVARNELDDATIHKVFRDEGPNVSVINGNTEYDFAWQAIGGVAFLLDDDLILDFAYTYADLGDAEFENTVHTLGHNYQINGLSYDVDVQEVTVGLRFLFS